MSTEDLKVVKQAVFETYDYLFKLGYFDSPTDEGRKIENLLIQARIKTNESLANQLTKES